MTKMTANGKKEPETQSDGMPEDMIQAERQQRMIDWFEQNVGGSNQELSRLFNASVSTIRRDLNALAARGVVRRGRQSRYQRTNARSAARRRPHRARSPRVPHARVANG